MNTTTVVKRGIYTVRLCIMALYEPWSFLWMLKYTICCISPNIANTLFWNYPLCCNNM